MLRLPVVKEVVDLVVQGNHYIARYAKFVDLLYPAQKPDSVHASWIALNSQQIASHLQNEGEVYIIQGEYADFPLLDYLASVLG